jgi:hypothetical protein
MTATYIIDIMRKLNDNNRYKLTFFAINIARVRGVSPVKAIQLIESGEIDLKDVEEFIIESMQEVQPTKDVE